MGGSESVELEDPDLGKSKMDISEIDFLVSAFIHDLERECQNDWPLIPVEIIHLCSLFCTRFDSWDLELKHKKMRITFGNTTIYHHWRYRRDKMQSWQTAFGNKVCIAGKKYEWTLAITKIDKNTYNHWKILIGVMKNCHCSTLITWRTSHSDDRYSTSKFFTCLSNSGYAFIGSIGGITTGNKVDKIYSRHDDKTEKFEKVGDVIKVILDMNTYELSFVINGYNAGIAYKVTKDWDYRLAVSMTEGRYIQMVDSESF